MLTSEFYTLVLSFFILMDSIGNIPLFSVYLKHLPAKRQRQIIVRELLIALLIIGTFYFIGEWLLTSLGIGPPAIQVSGGIILFLIAIKLVFADSHVDKPEAALKEEPFIVPLAIPCVAGPGILTATMFYSHQGTTATTLTALFVAWLFTFILLYFAPLLQKVLKKQAMSAIEKLMGLLLTMMAVEMFLEGFSSCMAK